MEKQELDLTLMNMTNDNSKRNKEFYEKMKGEAMSQKSEEIIQQLLEEVSEDDAH